MSLQITHTQGWTQDHHRLMDLIATKRNYEAKLLVDNVENFRNSLNLADSSGMTLLHHAVKSGNVSMVYYFIDKGCNPNTIDQHGNSPLTTALSIKNYSIVELLFKNNVNIYEPTNAVRIIMQNDTRDYQPIIKIFEMLNADFLTDKREKVIRSLNEHNFTRFAAVVFGNSELAKIFLEDNYPVNFKEPMDGFTALLCAIKHARMKNAKILIDYGANVNVSDNSGFSTIHHYTNQCGSLDKNLEVLKCLVKGSIATPGNHHHVRVDLERLIIRSKKPIVKAVLQCINNLKNYFKRGRSLVEMLVLNENSDVIDLLDELNIAFDVNQICDSKHLNGAPMESRVLALALVKRCPKKIKFLMDHGANVNISHCSHAHIALNTAFTYKFNLMQNLGKSNVEAEIIELLLKHENSTRIADASHWNALSIYLTDVNKRSSKVIFAHLALLDALDKSPLNSGTRNEIQSQETLRNQYNFHIQQLEQMKNIKLLDRISLFEILTENNEKRMLSIARHEEFKLEFERIIENTPLEFYYRNIVQKRVGKAIDQIDLEKKAVLALKALSGLGTFVVHNIVGYLEYKDLKNVCEAESIVSITE